MYDESRYRFKFASYDLLSLVLKAAIHDIKNN